MCKDKIVVNVVKVCHSRSEAMVMTDSVVAWYSSSSMNSSWDDASPWKSWWSKSCCSGGALGSSWFTTSRLMLGACFRRSLLKICDLIVSSRNTLLCSLHTQAEHSWEPASSSSRDKPASAGVSLAEGSRRLGSSLNDSPSETSTVKHRKKLYLGMAIRGRPRRFNFFLSFIWFAVTKTCFTAVNSVFRMCFDPCLILEKKGSDSGTGVLIQCDELKLPLLFFVLLCFFVAKGCFCK